MKTTCSIIFDRPGDPWVQQNLEDMARSLDENLNRRGEGSARAVIESGLAYIEASADRETLQGYVDAFAKRMRRDGHRVAVEYDD